jgi:hypothetical protein
MTDGTAGPSGDELAPALYGIPPAMVVMVPSEFSCTIPL